MLSCRCLGGGEGGMRMCRSQESRASQEVLKAQFDLLEEGGVGGVGGSKWECV